MFRRTRSDEGEAIAGLNKARIVSRTLIEREQAPVLSSLRSLVRKRLEAAAAVGKLLAWSVSQNYRARLLPLMAGGLQELSRQ